MLNQTAPATPWWDLDKTEVYAAVYEEVERIQGCQTERFYQMMEGCALYGDQSAWPGLWNVSRSLPLNRRLSHNVIATATDALVAEVTQSIPRPMAVTIGGTYDDRIKARSMTQYWDAKFEESSVHDLARQAVRDSILYGVGVLRPYREGNYVKVERLLPPQVLVDDRGVVSSVPRTYYIQRVLDRYYLLELFADNPEAQAMIEAAEAPNQNMWYLYDVSDRSDVVEVIEAYHLQSGKAGKDGRRALVLSSGTLELDDYERDRPPLCFVRAVPPLYGFYGESLVRRAAPAQIEMNKLLFRVQQSMHLHAVPRVFMNRSAGITKSHMQNDVGIIVEYEGQPPVFLTPQSMGADVYEHIMRLEQWVYKEMGISELSATSKKPAGLDSGAALRVYNDVQSRRWINLQRSYEQMIVDIAKELVFLEKDIGNHSVACKGKYGIDMVTWKDIDLEEDKFCVRVFAASALPNTPAGKLQALEEMVKTGVIDTKTFIKLADVPDLESVRQLVIAPEELLEKRFEQMLSKGEYIGPEPELDLVNGRVIASLMIQQAWLEGAKEDRLGLLRKWIGDSLALEQRLEDWAQQEMAEEKALMAPPPMPPPMPPGAPPQLGMPPPLATPTQAPATSPFAGQLPVPME